MEDTAIVWEPKTCLRSKVYNQEMKSQTTSTQAVVSRKQDVPGSLILARRHWRELNSLFKNVCEMIFILLKEVSQPMDHFPNAHLHQDETILKPGARAPGRSLTGLSPGTPAGDSGSHTEPLNPKVHG